ncbi:TMEM165/GDT1 family protein [Sphingomonas sp. PAMC 26621]|uniref:TMEM165/GDT1 family protein n=1 Tax=Sphingomonas sp. PAMC 26621 TaxID=1112213 RepID=UPI0002DC3AE6|nr:TMEM165/GDT1 family protein [Sphingomonas sp. PAMC 26621]
MAALVVALMVQASDRTALTSALLGTRYAGKGGVLAGLALALALGNAAGAVGGWLIAPLLSPQAADLLVALAIVSAGASALWPIRLRALPGRYGGFATALFAVGLLAIGDRTQFVTAALAARTPMPALPAIGATLGALAVNIPAVVLGERRIRRLPLTAIRLGAAALLLLSGTFQGLSALRLI